MAEGATQQKVIDTTLAYKEAKGKLFTQLRERGVKHHDAWQRVASDPNILKLERAMMEARAEAGLPI